MHALLGWDRPIHGQIAASQLINLKEALEESVSVSSNSSDRMDLTVPVPPSRSMLDAYCQIVPKVLGCLSKALATETAREGMLVWCGVVLV